MSDKQLAFEDMPRPVGEFILTQKDIQYMQKFDGAWFHYKDVCTLLQRYAASQPPAVKGEDKYELAFIPCAEDDPRSVGGFTSDDGQSLCHVRELHLPVVKEGAVWVKAWPKDEITFPEEGREVFIRHSSGTKKMIGDADTIIDLLETGRSDVEWLDESGASPTAAGDGKEGQELLDWIYENDIIRTEDGTWEKWDNGKALYRLFASGIGELYDIFKQQNK